MKNVGKEFIQEGKIQCTLLHLLNWTSNWETDQFVQKHEYDDKEMIPICNNGWTKSPGGIESPLVDGKTGTVGKPVHRTRLVSTRKWKLKEGWHNH